MIRARQFNGTIYYHKYHLPNRLFALGHAARLRVAGWLVRITPAWEVWVRREEL